METQFKQQMEQVKVDKFSKKGLSLQAKIVQTIDNLHAVESIEDAEFLKSIGFENAINVKESMLIDEHKWKAHYEVEAFGYRYLSERMVNLICEQYNIVYGDSSLYIDSIPKSCVEDIKNFHAIATKKLFFKQRDVLEQHYFDDIHLVAKYCATKESLKHINATTLTKDDISLINVALEEDFKVLGEDINGLWVESRSKEAEELDKVCFIINSEWSFKFGDPFHKLSYMIMANINMFTNDGVKLHGYNLKKKDYSYSSSSIPEGLVIDDDPIVCAEVQGGYLLVTAWGDELQEYEKYRQSKLN